MSLLGSALLLQEISQALGNVNVSLYYEDSSVTLSVSRKGAPAVAYGHSFKLHEITQAKYPSVLADQFISRAREVLNGHSQ